MKEQLWEKIKRPWTLFVEAGGIVGACEKSGRVIGKTLKGVIDIFVAPPVCFVVLIGVEIYSDFKKEEDKLFLLKGNNDLNFNTTSINKIIDLEEELKNETITLGAKKDIFELLELTKFDQTILTRQYKKRLKEVHPDVNDGDDTIFLELQKIMEELRWTWFLDWNNLNPEDKLKFESLTYPVLRAKSWKFNPKYRNGEFVGKIKVVSMATCEEDTYRCRNTTNNEVVFLTEEELSHEQI